MKNITILIPIMVAILFVFHSPVHAQCRPGYILVDEDQDYYYCKERSTYVKCIAEAGALLRNAKPQCAAEVEKCFRSEESTLSTAALTCGLGCLGSKLNLSACLVVCGLSAVSATRVFEKCGVDRFSDCFGKALEENRRAVDACKKYRKALTG